MELKKATITKILELKVVVVKLRMKAVMVVQVVLLVVVVVVLGGLPQTRSPRLADSLTHTADS